MANITFIAADVGNSRIKIGRFEPLGPTTGATSKASGYPPGVPLPAATLQFSMRTPEDRRGGEQRLREWLASFPRGPDMWFVASVHGGNDRWLEKAVLAAAPPTRLHRLSHAEMPLTIRVEAPDRVGLDRLAGAVAAYRLRTAYGAAEKEQATIVVDFGTAITVDLVSAAGEFDGGAILPGIAMAAEALERQTDALPRSPLAEWTEPPHPVGKATLQAIEAGLLWGAVGAVRELIERISALCDAPPLVFVTGGASLAVVPLLQSERISIMHVPDLVLSGVAIAAQMRLDEELAAGHIQ